MSPESSEQVNRGLHQSRRRENAQDCSEFYDHMASQDRSRFRDHMVSQDNFKSQGLAVRSPEKWPQVQKSMILERSLPGQIGKICADLSRSS